MTEANYKEFSELPAWTRAEWTGPANDRKVVNAADPFKWSGENDPPAIGAKVKVLMNNLGNATVVGYFAEYGWFGLLVKFSNPPSWYVKQNKERGGKNCVGHIFGVDLEPRKKAVAS